MITVFVGTLIAKNKTGDQYTFSLSNSRGTKEFETELAENELVLDDARIGTTLGVEYNTVTTYVRSVWEVR